jgi:MoxR-vWA-beta-propeller ternary system protein
MSDSTHAWAIRLHRADAAALAPLRLCPGVEVAEGSSDVWLRGRATEDWVHRALRRMPAVTRFEWLAQDRLRPIESRIPADAFPPLSWQPLDRWLQATLPLAALPAWEPRPVPLRLVRSEAEVPADLLVTGLGEWTSFALSCPEVRLRALQFAVTTDQRALVRGRPLPPLPGRRFVAHGPVAVPAGYSWRPAVSVAVVIRRLGLPADALALWHEDGAFTRLHAEQLVAATRSAVRATLQALTTP